VKGFPPSWTHADLYAAFKDFGPIESAKVSLNENFESRKYGFIKFQSVLDASTALETMNGKDLPESVKLQVAKFEQRRQKGDKKDPAAGESAAKFNNLFFKNFPGNWTDEQL